VSSFTGVSLDGVGEKKWNTRDNRSKTKGALTAMKGLTEKLVKGTGTHSCNHGKVELAGKRKTVEGGDVREDDSHVSLFKIIDSENTWKHLCSTRIGKGKGRMSSV